MFQLIRMERLPKDIIKHYILENLEGLDYVNALRTSKQFVRYEKQWEEKKEKYDKNFFIELRAITFAKQKEQARKKKKRSRKKIITPGESIYTEKSSATCTGYHNINV